jgi:hypothetical protein
MDDRNPLEVQEDTWQAIGAYDEPAPPVFGEKYLDALAYDRMMRMRVIEALGAGETLDLLLRDAWARQQLNLKARAL